MPFKNDKKTSNESRDETKDNEEVESKHIGSDCNDELLVIEEEKVTVLEANVEATILGVRKYVKKWRKSPRSNEYLQCMYLKRHGTKN